MKRRVVGLAVLGLAGLVGSSALAAAPSAYTRPGRTESTVVGSGGASATYPASGSLQCDSRRTDITPDGRYVVFDSSASNLVPNDTNAMCDVFRFDTVTRRTVRVSVAENGAQALAGDSARPTISADGRYVAFESRASNLVPGNTNLCTLDVAKNKQPYCMDVYVKDVTRGTITRVSVSSSGQQAKSGNPVSAVQGADSYAASISTNGKVVAFQSVAVNFDPGRQVGTQIFVHDLQTRRTVRASTSSTGQPANDTSDGASLSGNGRFVVFESAATNLVAGRSGGSLYQVFVHDLRTRETKLASVASDGTPAGFSALPYCQLSLQSVLPTDLPPQTDGLGPRPTASVCMSTTTAPNMRLISDDGRYVVFYSNATNLVPNDHNFKVKALGALGGFDVFLHDMWTGRTERLSVDPYGQESSAESGWPQISANGRYVTFGQTQGSVGQSMYGTPINPCPTDATSQIESVVYGGSLCQPVWAMLTDRVSGASDLVDANAAGGKPTGMRCSADAPSGSYVSDAMVGRPTSSGRFVPFWSNASDLQPGRTATACQYYLRDRGPAVGFGGLTGASVAAPTPGCGLPVCPPPPIGAGLQQARVISRQGLQDLFIRWDVSRMAPVAGAPAGGLLYELRFTSGGQHYAVRAQRVLGADFDTAGGASFGLFRESTAGLWTRVASLKGGYGTIGDSVVTAVPLSLLGGKAQLADVTAYTAVGNYMTGPTKVLDALRLTSRGVR